MEGSITNFQSKTLRADGTTGNAPLDFTFATTTALALKQNGVDIVSLANNHSFNRGKAGLDQTRENLTRSGVDFFGDPNNSSGNLSIKKCIDGICIGIVGYHEFAYKNDDAILNEINKLRKDVDVLIVMPHWGIEYQKTPSSLQKRLAHEWIDAGADIIVGAHPHIIESIEEYRGHPIFYSLGNYIFDQTFSFDTTHGLTLGINITKNNSGDETASSTIEISYDLKPVENSSLAVKIPNVDTINKIISDLESISKPYMAEGLFNKIFLDK